MELFFTLLQQVADEHPRPRGSGSVGKPRGKPQLSLTIRVGDCQHGVGERPVGLAVVADERCGHVALKSQRMTRELHREVADPQMVAAAGGVPALTELKQVVALVSEDVAQPRLWAGAIVVGHRQLPAVGIAKNEHRVHGRAERLREHLKSEPLAGLGVKTIPVGLWSVRLPIDAAGLAEQLRRFLGMVAAAVSHRWEVVNHQGHRIEWTGCGEEPQPDAAGRLRRDCHLKRHLFCRHLLDRHAADADSRPKTGREILAGDGERRGRSSRERPRSDVCDVLGICRQSIQHARQQTHRSVQKKGHAVVTSET